MNANAPMGPTAIWITVGETYVEPAIVFLASLSGKVTDGMQLYVRDVQLGAEALRMIGKQAERSGLEFRAVQSDVGRFMEANRFPHTDDASTWARLLPYPEDGHRYVLELDIDMLVRHPLEELLTMTPPAGSPLLAVPAHYYPGIWRDQTGSFEDIGIHATDGFFMGGVWLIDTGLWQDVSDRALQLLSSEPGRWQSDLSVLNAACVRRWAPLEARWNVWTLATRGPFRFVRASGASSRAIARSRDVAIAHFPGHFKPWLPHYPWNMWKVEWGRMRRRSVLA